MHENYLPSWVTFLRGPSSSQQAVTVSKSVKMAPLTGRPDPVWRPSVASVSRQGCRCHCYTDTHVGELCQWIWSAWVNWRQWKRMLYIWHIIFKNDQQVNPNPVTLVLQLLSGKMDKLKRAKKGAEESIWVSITNEGISVCQTMHSSFISTTITPGWQESHCGYKSVKCLCVFGAMLV